MTGQSCAAVCVVLCILAATAHSFRLPEVPSMYDDEYGFPENQALDDYRGSQMNDINTPEMAYFPSDTVGGFPEEQALDDYFDQLNNELTYTPEINTNFPSDTAEGFPEEQALDDYYDQLNDKELTYTPEMNTYFPSDTAEALKFNFDPSKIKVTVIGTEICVSYSILKVCFEKSQVREKICGRRLGFLTLGCRVKDEERYGGLCYKKCSVLTNGDYPKRTATNTCAKNGCGQNQEKNAGLCYPKCKKYFKGVGPICWGSCSHFCGSQFKDTGLTCHRWIPAKTCKKPRYGRGVGILPFKPLTKGFGCNGFGVNGDGECAKIDILKFVKLPLGITCA